PPNNAVGVKVQEPIVLRFSKAIHVFPGFNSFINQWLKFSTGHAPSSVVITPDGRQATIQYNGPVGNQVSLTINGTSGQLEDLGGHPFDQDPGTPGNQSFSLTFSQTPQFTTDLPGIESGAGVVRKGVFAYALDREGVRGKLEVFDVSDSANPRNIS